MNALAQLYIEQSLELRFTTSTEATGWLSDRLKEQQAKMDASERALQEYREKEGLVGAGGARRARDAEARDAERRRCSRRAPSASRRRRSTSRSLLTGRAQIESFPLVSGSTQVQALKNDLTDLAEEEATLAETLGEQATPTW